LEILYMPYYTYKCRKCLEVFEEFRYPKDYRKEACCPKCSSNDTVKLLNAIPIHYKGKGFFSTDYK